MNEKNSFKHNLTVVCIKDEKEFYQLKQPWNKLVEKTETKSIFLRHEWYDAAWQWRKLDSHLYIVCIKRNDEFIGICPLLRRTIVRYGVSKNIIEPLSVPDTQYFDIIASPSDLIDVTSEFSQYLITNKSPWDLLIFSKVTTDSNMLRTLPSALKQYGFSYILKEGGVNPGIRLNTDWKSYYKTRSRRLKKGNNHVKNRLERNVEIQNFRCNSISSDLISETINTITLISAQSWKKMTKLTLDNTGPNAFINRLSEHACDNGWLSIWVLFFDKKPVAMEYQIIFNKIAYALRSFTRHIFELEITGKNV